MDISYGQPLFLWQIKSNIIIKQLCMVLEIIYLKSNRESMIMMMTIYVKCQIAAGIVEIGM